MDRFQRYRFRIGTLGATALTKVTDRFRPYLFWIAALGATALTAAAYLGTARGELGLGYPLDDAWIHQTYARNLVQVQEWAFIPGRPSAGSTAPIWSAYLALSYLVGLDHRIWTYLGGLALLVATAWLASKWLAARCPERAELAWTMALLIPIEWHLAWASLSGMETLGLAAVALLCFFWLETQRVDMFAIGLLIGLGAWLRPDALTLAAAPAGYLLLRGRARELGSWGRLVVGIAVPLIPYLAFQRWLSGEWWPNTFFAKQAEYAALLEIPYYVRLLAQIGVPGEWLGEAGLQPGGPLVGVLVVLVPGLLVTVRYYVRHRDWTALIPLAWTAVFLGLYALRLPVTYQHGRYAIPVVPVLLVLSSEGLLRWVDPDSTQNARRIASRAWILLVGASAVIFWYLGARAYARDVAIIESEMVRTAHWIRDNTPSQAIVAAHDIGALGYFAERELIDLAGLVSPEVISFIRDEPALAEYMNGAGVQYFVTFPGWYPELTSGLGPLFVSDGIFSLAAGGENMAVYRWDRTSFAP